MFIISKNIDQFFFHSSGVICIFRFTADWKGTLLSLSLQMTCNNPNICNLEIIIMLSAIVLHVLPLSLNLPNSLTKTKKSLSFYKSGNYILNVRCFLEFLVNNNNKGPQL